MAKLNLQDNSGDKGFFTILPNYIANHSTANDQALYFQMKRYAGESGKCFATEKTLMHKLGIGKKAYDKSLTYLLEKGWVTYIGMTDGKTRPIKTYSINNIWKLNSDYCKKISAERTLSSKDKSQKEGDKSQKQHKISSESNVEEDLTLRRTIEKNAKINFRDFKTMKYDENSFSDEREDNQIIDGETGEVISPQKTSDQNKAWFEFLNYWKKRVSKIYDIEYRPVGGDKKIFHDIFNKVGRNKRAMTDLVEFYLASPKAERADIQTIRSALSAHSIMVYEKYHKIKWKI